MLSVLELKQRIEEQRNKNIELYKVFQYRLHDENTQPLIEEWRLESKKLKQMIAELQELELKKVKKRCFNSQFQNIHQWIRRSNR
jgi:hypothetical protein